MCGISDSFIVTSSKKEEEKQKKKTGGGGGSGMKEGMEGYLKSHRSGCNIRPAGVDLGLKICT